MHRGRRIDKLDTGVMVGVVDLSGNENEREKLARGQLGVRDLFEWYTRILKSFEEKVEKTADFGPGTNKRRNL